ncbi:CCT4 [Cordylochernes scorpioides]|uniref:T-complex protein 1 subunit delta n=1 Tax=Cordylochernes scorpioides TaxID=51811 RepID=A0ABY6K533_9ARAC|nr:CCT4 [Cordylochernes scorpioides]
MQRAKCFSNIVSPFNVPFLELKCCVSAVADAIRTSLGPRGMDKMIQAGNGDVSITSDGATILKEMKVVHPAAKMLVELAKAQDVEAGDGTTSVAVIAGSMLDAAHKLLSRGIHPTTISEGFQAAAAKGVEILESISQPISLTDRETITKIAHIALNSKVVSQHSGQLAPMAVEAVLRVASETNVDLRDIKVIKKLGCDRQYWRDRLLCIPETAVISKLCGETVVVYRGTVEDTELVDGLVFDQKTAGYGGPHRVEKAKIGLIQFCISPPKTDMENQVIVSDYTQMDRVLREERTYILNIIKQIKKAGCNVLLIQKSILRDAVSELALHYLAKMKILVVKDIEREDIEFVCKSLNCRPIASLDHFTPEFLGSAELVEEVETSGGKYVKVTGVANPGRTVSLLVRASNKLVLEETERSLHDALCVVRCLVKKKALIAGGGAPEIELSLKLSEYSRTLTGAQALVVRALAESLEVIPSTLAENAGLNPIATVTELRTMHAQGQALAGINVRKGTVSNMLEENVLQPLLVSTSALSLASETVRSILKIDDVVSTWWWWQL